MTFKLGVRIGSVVIAAVGLTLFFQNCSPYDAAVNKGSSSDPNFNYTNVQEGVNGSSDLTPSVPASQSPATGSTAPLQNSPTGDSQGSISTLPPAAPVYEEFIYTARVNVVHGGGQAACNQTARNYNPGVSCAIGGGCGISCGKPGAGCPSANPTHWGACVDVTNHDYFFTTHLSHVIDQMTIRNPGGYTLPAWVLPYVDR
jgi:hypothetical protein